VADVELKTRIDAWVEERRAVVRAEKAAAAAEAAAEGEGDSMEIDG
jgi:regulator of protease activity HflC (stomatin/prohibitin superfamily)